MSTSPIATYSNRRLVSVQPYANGDQAIRLVASKSYPMGTRLKESGTRGVYDIWDGTGNWQMLCAYDCQTDASGNITMSPTSGNVLGDNQGGFAPNAVGIYRGIFDVTDLPSFDSAALAGAPAGARMIEGTVTAGLFLMP